MHVYSYPGVKGPVPQVLSGVKPFETQEVSHQRQRILRGSWRLFFIQGFEYRPRLPAEEFRVLILTMDRKQREELTALIEEEGGSKWWVPDKFLAHIKSRLPVELEIVAQPPPYSGNYNCFVFAFGLEKDPEFLGGQNPIQQEFIKYLLESGVLKIKTLPEPGGLIFYRDSDSHITHGGIVESDSLVISKWMWGAIIRSGIWDVPSSFGDEIFFCAPLESKLIKKEYFLYKESGVEIKPIA
jgi:hypothetical protein